jgi:hypothetical protein
MKIKKKHVVLIILLAICLFLVWFVSEFLREWECHEYSAFKKANEIIEKIEDYRKYHKKLPDSLEDIGEQERMEGPVYYNKWDSDNYTISFSGRSVGSSCVYHSETGEWTSVPVG